MPKTLQEIIDHADDMSAAFDHYQPDPATLRDPAPMLRARTAVQARAQAEADVAAAVTSMRSAGYSWAAIGMVVGTTGEAARQRYSEAAAVPRATTKSVAAAKSAKTLRPAPRTAAVRGGGKPAARSEARAAEPAKASSGRGRTSAQKAAERRLATASRHAPTPTDY